MREAIILQGAETVNVIVIPDGADGDAFLSESCIEITGMYPKPGLGIGWIYVDGVFVSPNPSVTWNDIRVERDSLLSASDWTRIDDASLSVEKKDAWAVYRQALRDIPQTFNSPDEVVWPTAP